MPAYCGMVRAVGSAARRTRRTSAQEHKATGRLAGARHRAAAWLAMLGCQELGSCQEGWSNAQRWRGKVGEVQPAPE